MCIGIEDEKALFYEGAGSLPDRLATPLPTVSLAKLIEQPEDWAGLPANSHRACRASERPAGRHDTV